MRALALAALLAGCGRIAFDHASDAPGPCGVPATAPDLVTITGTTFEYTSFDESVPLPGVAVVVRDPGGTILGAAPLWTASTMTAPDRAPRRVT